MRMFIKVGLALLGTIALASRGLAQHMPDVISPPEVVSDPNGLNLVTGKVLSERPVISIPAAPRLTFSRPSDFVIEVKGEVATSVQPAQGYYTVHYGADRSERFECGFDVAGCVPLNSGSLLTVTYLSSTKTFASYTHEKSGETYSFNNIG